MATLKLFLAFLGTTLLCFYSLFFLSLKISLLTSQYDWAIQHWGIKWDCSIEIVDRTDDFLELQFTTPWKSPDTAIDAIAKLFPSLTFEMNSSEPGCDWQEFCSWQDGHLVQKTTGHFYQQSSSQCPECKEDYHPEIDLYGNITFSQCFECGWTD